MPRDARFDALVDTVFRKLVNLEQEYNVQTACMIVSQDRQKISYHWSGNVRLLPSFQALAERDVEATEVSAHGPQDWMSVAQARAAAQPERGQSPLLPSLHDRRAGAQMKDLELNNSAGPGTSDTLATPRAIPGRPLVSANALDSAEEEQQASDDSLYASSEASAWSWSDVAPDLSGIDSGNVDSMAWMEDGTDGVNLFGDLNDWNFDLAAGDMDATSLFPGLGNLPAPLDVPLEPDRNTDACVGSSAGAQDAAWSSAPDGSHERARD